MKAILAWLDNRTGYKHLLNELLYENVPGGARWRYVWGSTLTFTLAIQVITGIFLWMAYSPSSQTAWASVYYIQHEMVGGWFLRGLHHYTAQVMNILLLLHLMQVIIDGAYKAPREVNYWFGLGLLLLVLGLSLTGYLLPWDQKGYWATKVATNIVAITPVVGPDLQKLIVGGVDYGHHTLTRFFALHAGVLPGLIVLLLVGHIYLFRRHGIKAKEPKRRPDAAFWPDQVLKDAVACLAVLGVVLALVMGSHGASLGAPADPAEPFNAARPEWYFLFLFQFLKYFPGTSEIWGAIIIPSLLLGVVGLIPFLGKWRLGHRFNLGFMFSMIAGAALLTYLAIQDDNAKPEFRRAVAAADLDAERVVVLAGSPVGIPREGAVALLRNDPLTMGPRLFARNCASCHRFDGHDGLGSLPVGTYTVQSNETAALVAANHGMTEEELRSLNASLSGAPATGQKLNVYERSSAPDLKGFGSREWLTGLLDPNQITNSHYYGGTAFADGKMAKFVTRKVAGFSDEEKADLAKVIMTLSAEAQLPGQREADLADAAQIKEGRTVLEEDFTCMDCHLFHNKDEEVSAPDLTGYASKEWLKAFITQPSHARFYGDRNDRMPAFGADKILFDLQIDLLVDWLRGEWYMPATKPSP